jgi:dihydrodipicolinate synthase/N-acetylneuraminate lyase
MAIEGIIVPPPAPMDARGEALDLSAVPDLVESLVVAGVNGLFVNGTTGESALLDVAERMRLAEAFQSTVAGRAHVIVQVGAASTTESVRLASHAAETGVSAVAIVAPYYFAHDQSALERHAEEVAEAAAPRPAYLYDIPSRTGNGYGVRVAERLAKRGVVVGAKDSSGDLPKMLELLAIPEFQLLPGADQLALVCLQAGAAGVVSGPAAVVPEPYVQMWKAFRQGDIATAARCHRAIVRIARAIGYGGDIPLIKGLIRERLEGVGAPRLPHVAPSAQEVRAVRGTLDRILQEEGLAGEAAPGADGPAGGGRR